MMAADGSEAPEAGAPDNHNWLHVPLGKDGVARYLLE